MAGVFITFEGLDGSGKSTQLRLLAEWLGARGCAVCLTREPGGTPLGLKLRAALLDANEEVDPLAELLLFAADRAQHVNTVVRPALTAGRIVLSDRYSAATAAYQGAGREFSPTLIAQVIEFATGGLKPDLTLLFDISAETSLFRTRHRAANDSQPDRLDSESLAFHQRVRQGYLDLAQAEAERWRVFDADLAVEAIQTQVRACIADFLVASGFGTPEAFA